VKVVLFCGGLGMRMRDGATSAPKPMAMVWERRLLWHVMRYYAHFGHTVPQPDGSSQASASPSG
jgi:glucose-1-phosphate cytidylyltransferase